MKTQRSFHQGFAGVPILLSFLFLSVVTPATTLAGPISVTKTDGRETAAPGDLLTYSITITNAAKQAKKVAAKDLLSPLTVFLSASDGGELYNPHGPGPQGVVWKDLQIPKLGSKTVTVTVQVKADVPDGTVITNTVKVEGNQSAIDRTTVKIPAQTGNLFVTVKDIGSQGVAVSNENDIPFLRFEASGDHSEMLLTSVQFSAQAGSLLNAQRYALWVDTDKSGSVDTIIEGNVAATNGKVLFHNLVGGGMFIPSDPMFFEVHGGIASSLVTNELQLQFDIAAANYVEAELAENGQPLLRIETNGSCPAITCSIHVTTTPSILYTLANQGNLYVTQSSTPTRSRQLLGGTLGDPILRLAFRAESEPIDVTRIVFTDLSGTLRPSIDRLELFLPGATTRFATATIGGCAGSPSNAYCASMESQQFVVPEGQTVEVLVQPRMKTDEDGAVSGEVIQLQVAGDTAVRARGISSANTLSVNDGDALAEGEVFIGAATPLPNVSIVGRPNDTVLAKIIAIENVNPAADGSNVPVGTNKTIAEFKFTAATNQNTLNGRNKASLSGVIFNIASANVSFTAANFDLYNKNDQTQQIRCTSYDGNGNGTVVGNGSGSFFVLCKQAANTSVDLEVDSDEALTLALEADIITNQINPINGSALTVVLSNFADRRKTIFRNTGNDSHISWSDSLYDATVTLFRWIENSETEIASTSYDL